jgi:hypothetical protein
MSRAEFWRWTHAALVVSAHGAIVEAVGNGVVVGHLENYRDADYHYVAVQLDSAQRRAAIQFAASRVGNAYNRVAIARFSVSTVTGRRIPLKASSPDICAGLVAQALGLGLMNSKRSRPIVTPCDLARRLDIRP